MSPIQYEEGMGMIYLGMSPWEGMWRNRQQLMSRFAKMMPVLYVEPWTTLKKVRRSLLQAGTDSDGRHKSSPEIEGLGIFHGSPLLPVSGSRYLAEFTQRRWYAAIRRRAKRLGITRPILWISRPEFSGALGRMNESISIYHIVDEYGGYTSQNEATRQRLWEAERQLIDAVDFSIAVSSELVSNKGSHSGTVHLVENAVDVDAFIRVQHSGMTPADLSGIPRPRLGYCGLIGKRLDLALLKELARCRPDGSIVLVGKVDTRDCAHDLEELGEMENVYILGERDVSEVPAYITGFDVGLLPYQLNLETKNISPLKMYEYLAAGIPVVSTDIPAARRQDKLVHVAHTAGAFADACREELVNDNAVRKNMRLDYARSNTWDCRVEQICDLIVAGLERRASGEAAYRPRAV